MSTGDFKQPDVSPCSKTEPRNASSLSSLSERDFAVAVVEDGGRGGARSEETHAAAAEPAKEAALAAAVAVAAVHANVPAVARQLV